MDLAVAASSLLGLILGTFCVYKCLYFLAAHAVQKNIERLVQAVGYDEYRGFEEIVTRFGSKDFPQFFLPRLVYSSRADVRIAPSKLDEESPVKTLIKLDPETEEVVSKKDISAIRELDDEDVRMLVIASGGIDELAQLFEYKMVVRNGRRRIKKKLKEYLPQWWGTPSPAH
jgi:hypothetical protein